MNAKKKGVGITTNGISATVHFIVPKCSSDDNPKEITNLLNIEQLSLIPTDYNDHNKSNVIDNNMCED
jgi:hypothetical protein